MEKSLLRRWTQKWEPGRGTEEGGRKIVRKMEFPEGGAFKENRISGLVEAGL